MDIRSNVNVMLAKRRMTKRELSERLGISRSTLWEWTTDDGIAQLSLAKLSRLAQVLCCNIKDLYEE